MRLFQREANDCKAGTSWYVCNSPQYRGCCSVDACHLGGCPDQTTTKPVEPSRTITAVIQDPTDASSTTTLSTITALPLTSIAPTVTSAAETSQATGHASSVSSTPSPTLPVSLPIESVPARSSSHKGAIIGGSVAGVVVLTLIAALLWYCCRKRKNGRAAAIRSVEPKGPSYREMNAEEVQRLSPQDIFAPFGGYQRSNSMQDRRASNASLDSQQTVIITRAPRPVSEVHEEDAPIRDMEKSSLPAPPLNDHPAMHPLPGQSPEVPTYHPGQEITSPELAQHPAYLAKHPSLINRYTARSSTASMSSNLRSHPKTHLTFPFMNLASPTRRPAEASESSNSLSTLPSQKRRNRLSRKFLRRSYTPISTAQSSPIEQKLSPLQDVHSPIPGRSELPAVVPQELSSTPVGNSTNGLDMFKIAAERRMRCSPTGLGVKSQSNSSSPSQKQSTVISPPTQTKPIAINTEIIQTPAAPYHPSPRSADSPALNSEFYQSHIVSPDVPSGQFVAYGHTFDRKPHVSQMQIPASRSSPPQALRHRASHPPDSPSPPQRPRIDTGMSSRGFKGRVKHKESLGKGTENVMSWATYNNSRTSSLLPTPSQKFDDERGQIFDIPLPLQIPQQRHTQKQEEEQESPILPPFFLHPARGSEMLINGKETMERWSGSTATVEACAVKDGDMLEPGGAITHSPSVYSNDGDGNRYSKMSGAVPVPISKEKGKDTEV